MERLDCAEFQRLVETGTEKEWDKRQLAIEKHSAQCVSCSYLLTSLAEKAGEELSSADE